MELEHEADNLSSSSDEVNNQWSLTSTSLFTVETFGNVIQG
jgi:hypothetical protein